MRLPIRLRLTFLTAVLTAAVLGGGGAILYSRFAAGLQDATDSGLLSRAETMLAAIESSGGGLGGGGIIEPDEAFAQVLDGDGTVLESSAGLPPEPLLPAGAIRGLSGPAFLQRTVATAEEPVEARILAVPGTVDRIVLVGASLEDQREAKAQLAALLWVGMPVAVGLTSLLGWWLAGAALRPMERMRAEAAAISASELDRRLSVPETGDEVARLGETLNGLLDRLGESIERERRFVDDASHELRTPLANLRAELDLALRGARSREELEAALRSAAEESDRLGALAEDLLVLARAERGRLPIRRSRIAVDQLADEVAGTFAARAAADGVRIQRSGAPTRGDLDPARIRQVLANLVDNALRHTPAGGTVEVRVAPDDGAARIEVLDTGEGFPQAFLERAFDAFAIPDRGRGGGSGLGLAIVKAIAEAHGGTAQASNGPDGGAIVTVTLRWA
jgi:heavy metal sensor kinase